MGVPHGDEKERFECPSIVREEFGRLKDQERTTLDMRLRHHAKQHYGWIPDSDLEGLIQDAKDDAYFGVRRRRKGTTLEIFLIEIINSKASHYWEKASIAPPEDETPGPSQGTTKPGRIRRRQFVDDINEPVRRSPHSFQPSDVQRRVECEEIFDEACEIVCHDRILIGILKLKKEDPRMTLKEMAERLGTSMNEIWNKQRCLRRKLADLRKEWLNVKDR